ncbi:hypothetical protein WA026_000017 [Henosepilachna vigintioctopunctata]|uniref:Coiled-coil domain-containing protein 186 n=1 Tax=Henosepilachna vigintioctopunctata TaxID=420089 RepID=A0AAW1UW45_9CUCU
MTCEVPIQNKNSAVLDESNCEDHSLITEGNNHPRHEINKSIFTISKIKCFQELRTDLNPESWGNIEKCQQLLFEYYMKSEDLENKCTILHRNLQEVKNAWERAKIVKDDALKEKENMTIKYATSEKRVIDERKMKEKLQKKCEDLSKENNLFQQKLQAMVDEKTRICNLYDNKIHELKELQIDNNRIKNDNCILENELKLCHKALKKQAELYHNSQSQFESKSDEKVNPLETINASKEEHENQECIFNQNVPEQRPLITPSECFEKRYKEVEQQNHELSQKLGKLEVEKLEITKAFKIWVEPILQNEKNLQISTLETDSYNMPMINAGEQLKSLNIHLRLLKSKNADLEIDIEACRDREAEALLFTQQVTDMAMKLQSDYNILKKKIEELKGEQMSMKNVNAEYESHCDNLIKQLTEEKQNSLNEKIEHNEEIRSLKKELSALNVENLQLKQQVHDWQEEIHIIKRKYKLAMREMQKQMEIKASELIRYPDKKLSNSLPHNFPQMTHKSCSNHQVQVIQPEGNIEPKTLIERIVQLQRINARKSEKLDFLEDQVNTLILELQKKSKLIQIYMLRDRTNALTTNTMDECKCELKNGFMASINSGSIADKHLTLDMSLQINKKLQAVLEDALLENIILKENIDKLGHEIEKLDQKLKS